MDLLHEFVNVNRLQLEKKVRDEERVIEKLRRDEVFDEKALKVAFTNRRNKYLEVKDLIQEKLGPKNEIDPKEVPPEPLPKKEDKKELKMDIMQSVSMQLSSPIEHLNLSEAREKEEKIESSPPPKPPLI